MFWIVSVPCDDSRVKSFKRLKKQLQQDQKLCECFEFRIPKLRHGTLDQLMSLSDELVKHDSTIEGIAVKVLRQLADVNPNEQNPEDFVPEVIMQEDNTAPVELYLNFFQWDENQYLLSKSLKDLTDQLLRKSLKYEEELKVKSNEYSTLKTQINTIERKRTGPLTTRLLDGIVKREHIPVDTEYLQTIFVVVPKMMQKEWLSKYESLDTMPTKQQLQQMQHTHVEIKPNDPYIVPGSSELITEDAEYALYNVIVLRKKSDDFKKACQDNKFFPRDFEFDESRYQLSLLEKEKMNEKKDTMKKDLFEWCKMAFSETFSAWIHIKAIRTFVESVLRYGLPPKFVSLLLKVTKNEKKVHKFFSDQYKYLQDDHPATVGGDDTIVASIAQEAFYPYVLIALNTDPFFKS